MGPACCLLTDIHRLIPFPCGSLQAVVFLAEICHSRRIYRRRRRRSPLIRHMVIYFSSSARVCQVEPSHFSIFLLFQFGARVYNVPSQAFGMYRRVGPGVRRPHARACYLYAFFVRHVRDADVRTKLFFFRVLVLLVVVFVVMEGSFWEPLESLGLAIFV